MRINRKGQPLVYTRVAIKGEKLEAERKRAQAWMDIAIGMWGFAFLVFLLAWLG